MAYLWVAIGSALGGVGRFWLSASWARQFGDAFPWSTLIVNVTGSFAIGFFATLTQPGGRVPVATSYKLFFVTGICGGYTTFSAFSLQTLQLVRDGKLLGAGGNILLSVTCCLLAVWLGHLAAAALNPARGS